MDTGLLILRIVVGLLFVGHGTQKLFGWFGGPGLAGASGFFESLGYRPGRPFAVAGGLVEALGGLLLAIGLAVPLAAAMIIGQMLNAAWTVHKDNGLWSTNGGYEYPLVLAASAAALAFTGPGAFSLDGAFGLNLQGLAWGAAAVVAGLAVGAVALAARRPERDVEIDVRERETAEQRSR